MVEFILGRIHSDIAMETGSGGGGAELSILSKKSPPKHVFFP